jgi:hypothetical protein
MFLVRANGVLNWKENPYSAGTRQRAKKQKTSNELAPSIIGGSGTAPEKLDWTITPLSGTTTDYIRLAMLLAHMEP